MTQLFEVLGGLGVFLLGVVIMTDGLRGVAGDALRGALTRFTRSPLSGACTGAISTAVLQSSSATTVAAVGFVGAGLLTFPQALGVVFGANLGTTITGWLVALLGFKLKLGTMVLPLILGGVLLHLFGKQRWAQGGLAMAGFGLIFVGIDAMQAGMSGMEGRITPDDFPSDNLIGRFQLLLIGVGITLITQSSSAGVAAALTAVHTGTISFEQAAAMVIGMDIGTTATALFATIGGATESRRTGYSHVIYNLCTGLGAFILLSPYVWLWQWLAPGELLNQPEIALVAFHSGFNALGIILVLPVARPFANFIIRLVPEKTSTMVRHLDKHLLKEPFVALEAARTTLEEINLALLQFGRDLIHLRSQANAETLLELADAIEQTQRFLDQIHSSPEHAREWQFLMACMHGVDHMQRLCDRYAETRRAQNWQRWTELAPLGKQLDSGMQQVQAAASTGNWAVAAKDSASLAETCAQTADDLREQIMSNIASGREDTVQGDLQLETTRWIRRVADHLWRISHHMQLADQASHKETPPAESVAAA